VIRRHLTPAVSFFCLFLAAVFLWKLPHAADGGPRGLPAGACAAAVSIGLAGVSLVLLGAAPPRVRRAGALLFAAALGSGAGAAALGRMAAWRLGEHLPAQPAEISEFTGVLRLDSTLSREGDTLLRLHLVSAGSVARGVSGSARGDALVICRGARRFAMGERVRVHAALRPLAGDGPESLVAVLAPDRLDRLGFDSRLWALRAGTREAAQRAFFRAGYPASALLEALVTGSREDVPAGLAEGFRRTGTLHVLALSGLHVGIVYGLALAVLAGLRWRALRVWLACLVVIVYQVFAGFMPSLERATLMILAAGVASLLDRDREPLNLLALSGIAVLALDPFQAFSASFQLSYLALAGILLVGPLVERALRGRMPRFLLAPLAASIGAQLATLPVVLPAFGAWYPSGILAGILLVPLVSLFLALGLCWLVLSPLVHGWALAAGAAVFDTLYRAIEGTASAFARLPGIEAAQGASWPVPAAACAAAVVAAAVVSLPWRLPWRAR
jgi:ComEC/Rec2-related protein